MTINVWYTKQYEDGWEGAEAIQFKTLADAWNYYNEYKRNHKNDKNLMLTVDGTQIA